MKIVTYNLRNGGKKGSKQWEKIIEEFSPDLILAQETRQPQSSFPDEQNSLESWSSIWNPVNPKWGSAILAPRYEIIPIPVQGFEGWVVGGKIDSFAIGGVARPVSIFSIHTPSGNYEKNVNDILDCVQKVADGSEILIGGDFNITTAVRHPGEGSNNTKAGLAIFDRLRKKFGLINCWQVAHPNENLHQTLRWTGDKEFPYHCDGIFIPHSWLRYLESCEIVSAGWPEMSDHNPIVATFST